MKKTEIIITSIILLTLIFIVSNLSIGISCSRFGLYDDTGFWENILVEAHGMILDLFFAGIVLVIILNYFEKKRDITKSHEEIDFNRHINTKEAKYKIFSLIRSLNRKK